ncbi:hypothetical protein B296_00046561 [Ensete ventricosum]|uniref:Uncharacterized protein n=1 Tax=Ensete ventricosum TaxID=4639 RepID=A0A426XGG9_ENSVE|nr:hypothetical protein B296_00046561 [Ensete ventricosum]
MVAISLYRGNLHRVPDVPRRWTSPPPVISLIQFKILIRRRSEALSRLSAGPAAVTTLDVKHEGKSKEDVKGDDDGAKIGLSVREYSSVVDPEPSNSQPKCKEETRDHGAFRESEVGASASDAPAGAPSTREEEEVRDSKIGEAGIVDGKFEVRGVRNKSDVVSDKEERKQELEKKLHVLNEKKHNLVQMLKQVSFTFNTRGNKVFFFLKSVDSIVPQILNAEEEIKRRSMQSPVLHPSIPQKAEMALEMGSVKQVPKLTVEVNFGSDSGGESDAAAKNNSHVRQLHHIHSTSPSAASLTRTTFGSFQHNTVSGFVKTKAFLITMESNALQGLQNIRGSIAATGHGPTTPNSSAGGAMVSPSRFAPVGHQSQTPNLTPVALPVNHFIASSPSPAASGGASSVFMDPCLTSSS